MPMPGMPQQPGMPAKQPALPPQVPANSPAQKYFIEAQKLLPSVTERNPYIKEQVGHLIYDYVQMIIGTSQAPKITGMLIELPVP